MTARNLILTAMLVLATAGARADDFYAERLQRGIANYQRGNYAHAASDLRIAAFGLLDSPADYERALIYTMLANWKLDKKDDATQMAEKIVNVERVAPVYGKLTLPAGMRQETESVLPKLLRPEQLRRAPSLTHLETQSSAPPPPPQPRPQPQPQPSRPAPTPPPPPSAAQAMSLLQGGDEAGARAVAEKIVADDYTNALAQTVLAILAGRRGDWAGVVEHYSVVRTRRRLTDDEHSAFYMGLVRTRRTADAAGVAKLRGAQAFVAKATPAPAPPPAAPVPVTAPAPAAATPAALLADANRALREGRLAAARDIYQRLSAQPNLPRDVALGVAGGLHQTAAFRASSAEYQKLYPLRSGEEVHMFNEAVNRYEMGDYAIARKLLARALPSLPRTHDVELYRGRIERTQ